MTIRLVLPVCKKEYRGNESYCQDSFNNKTFRLKILQKSMLIRNKIDLVVTSNNFFGFITNDEKRLDNILNKLKNKIDLVIGVDYWKKKSYIGGISARVNFYKNLNNRFFIKKRLWETYPCNGNKAKYRFNLQQRVVKIGNTKVCLLSCGDILEQCNKGVFPQADIYLDLAHMSYIPLARKTYNHCSFINKKVDDNSIVILTQQFQTFKSTKTSNNFITKEKKINKKYIENNQYKYICPRDISQRIHYYDKYHNYTNNILKISYMFIDIKIECDI